MDEPSKTDNPALEQLHEIDREICLLNHTGALLSWDRETMMPRQGNDERARQLELLEGLVHDRLTAARTGELLEAAGSTGENPLGGEQLPEEERAFLRAFRREYDRAVKLPKRLVTDFAREVSISQQVWADAREKDDFESFSPSLERLLRLNREKAEALGYEEHPYDPLLDEFEPWMTTRTVSSVFADLREKLVPMAERITEQQTGDDAFLNQTFPVERQERFGRMVLDAMGYDFSRGRLDVSTHPFTTAVGGDDVRITTRYNPDYFRSSIFGTIHEAGHALYEMGTDPRFKGTILGGGTSLGIHESQSRMWENMIGRSISFWRHFYPQLRETFPEQLEEVQLSDFLKAVNTVRPSLIRIEADEVTYSLHIILRFELEQALITGDLAVQDLPGAWNDGMERLLGIRPGTDAEGVLQDIHWAMGAVGYFPTYALGNLYAAQFYRAMERQLGDVEGRIARGDLASIREWLGEHIHRPGASQTASELVRKVAGEELDPDYFISYLDAKFDRLEEV
jgi:carboxypeptidase Taq